MDWHVHQFERVQKLSAQRRLLLLHAPDADSLALVRESTAQHEPFSVKGPLELCLYNPQTGTYEHLDGVRKLPFKEPPIEERKQAFLDMTAGLLVKMEKVAEQEMARLSPDRDNDECWLHPNPKALISKARNALPTLMRIESLAATRRAFDTFAALSPLVYLRAELTTSGKTIMADSDNTNSLPERPREGEGPDGPASAPSKNALKKAAKEKEKAEKAAKRKAAEETQKAQAEAEDVSKEDYGDLPLVGSAAYNPPHDNRRTLQDISQQYTENTSFAEVPGGPKVVFRATVENAREQSAKLTFLVLGHKLDTIQAVVAASESTSRQMVKYAKNITQQSQVVVHGLVKKPKDLVKSCTIGWLEIHVERLFVIARAETPLPVQVEDCERALPEEDATAAAANDESGRPLVGLATRLNNRTIDLRSKLNTAIFLIKDGVADLFTSFLHERKFISTHTAKLLGAATEGGASVFPVKYFERSAFLAQSPQFYKQMLVAAQFERVMEIGPVFRAENSNTGRHLTEFTGLDLEMAFEEHYHEVVDLLEELMLHIFHGLRERYSKETELVRKTYNIEEFRLPAKGQKAPRLHYSEGVSMLRGAGQEMDDFDDLSTAHEKLLGKLVLDKFGSDFYILDQYPLAVRPFYTMPSSSPTPGSTALGIASASPAAVATGSDTKDSWPKGPYSNSFDFHMRGVEILSGAQRVHNAELLQERMRAQDPPVNPDQTGLKEYVDSFRHGCPPHGGAGLGLERIVMLWLGLPNVRLASLFPRDPGRLAP
ncbi:MAG: hypothetical protein Q9162_003377 [Coniocarpon cinnabarinum]